MSCQCGFSPAKGLDLEDLRILNAKGPPLPPPVRMERSFLHENMKASIPEWNGNSFPTKTCGVRWREGGGGAHKINNATFMYV